jgi:casein kinase 1
MATTHIINTSNAGAHLTSSGSHSSSSSNIVGVHYRVGKKIGEGSFGVIFEGTNLLNSQTVAIKFVGHKPPFSNVS